MNDHSGPEPVPALAHTCLLGESPVWDIERQSICWVDIQKGEWHEYSPQHHTHIQSAVQQMLGAIGLCTNGNLIAALQHGFGFIDRATRQLKMVTDPEAHLPGNRFNDGKCGPDGRFWAGTLSLEETPGAGSVYCLQPDLSVIKKITGVTISNGMGWSPDHQVLYYIDTPTREVAAYDYDLATGHIANKKTAVCIAEADGFPDGMTVDAEGMIWIACWGGWKVGRWNPHTGKKLLEIRLPAAHVSSCVFGGPQLQDLYITTATKDISVEALKEQPMAGSLFVVKDIGYTGLPPYQFINK